MHHPSIQAEDYQRTHSTIRAGYGNRSESCPSFREMIGRLIPSPTSALPASPAARGAGDAAGRPRWGLGGLCGSAPLPANGCGLSRAWPRALPRTTAAFREIRRIRWRERALSLICMHTLVRPLSPIGVIPRPMGALKSIPTALIRATRKRKALRCFLWVTNRTSASSGVEIR